MSDKQHRNNLHTNIQCPKISQTATTHSSINNKTWLLSDLFSINYSSVALSWRRQRSICDRYIPSHNARSRTQLEGIKVIQISESSCKWAYEPNNTQIFIYWPHCYYIEGIPRNVVLGVFTVIGKPPKKIALVAHKRKTVAQARAWWCSIFRGFWFQFFPFPSACLIIVTTEIGFKTQSTIHLPTTQNWVIYIE